VDRSQVPVRPCPRPGRDRTRDRVGVVDFLDDNGMTGHRFGSNRCQVAARSLPTLQEWSRSLLGLRALDTARANADGLMLWVLLCPALAVPCPGLRRREVCGSTALARLGQQNNLPDRAVVCHVRISCCRRRRSRRQSMPIGAVPIPGIGKQLRRAHAVVAITAEEEELTAGHVEGHRRVLAGRRVVRRMLKGPNRAFPRPGFVQ
jgi:hypothetical protein